MKNISLLIAGLCWITSSPLLIGQTASGKPVPLEPDAHGWYALFDGKTLSGWLSFAPETWHARADGTIVGDGPGSHLFSPWTYHNLEFRARVRINHAGNSGMYIRATLIPGFPKGYEAQVENTSGDPNRTGSLYEPGHPIVSVRQQLIPDDTWWHQEFIAVGNRLIIKVNGKVTVDYVDKKNTYTVGHLALQLHNKGSVVEYQDAQVKPLPNDERAAWREVLKDNPDLATRPSTR